MCLDHGRSALRVGSLAQYQESARFDSFDSRCSQSSQRGTENEEHCVNPDAVIVADVRPHLTKDSNDLLAIWKYYLCWLPVG